MKLLEFEVTNWGPHAHNLLQFDPNAKIIALAGENDKGKSELVCGMAGIFTTGQNEYFDANDVLDNEESATLRCKFLGRNGNHQVRRIIRKKPTDDAPNEIWLDGSLIAPTKFEEFLQEELRCKDPKIFLSLAVSKQGETHFYLKAKKREREEGMRSLSELDRIDAWKDHLSRIVSSGDKSLAEKRNTLLGRKTTLDNQIKQADEEIIGLEKAIRELREGCTPSGRTWNLEEQLKLCKTWQENREKITRAEQEIQSSKTNNNLYEEKLGKLEEQREESPLKTLAPNEIQEREEKFLEEENTHRTALLWKDFEAEKSNLKTLQEQLERLEKEIEALKPLLTFEEETLTKDLSEEVTLCMRTIKNLDERPKETMETLETELQKNKEELNKRKKEEEGATSAVNSFGRSKKLLDAALLDLGCKKVETTEEAVKTLEALTKSLQEKILREDIGKQEANILTQRVLANWDKKKEHDCPICCDNLEENIQFLSAEARKKTLGKLTFELGAEGETPNMGSDELRNLIAAQYLLKREIPQVQLQERELKTLLDARGTTTIAGLEGTQEKISKKIVNLKSWKTAEENQMTSLEKLAKTLSVSSTEAQEKAKILLADNNLRKENRAAKLALATSTKSQISQSEEKIKESTPKSKSPQVRLLDTLNKNEIQSNLEKIAEELKAFRIEKTKLEPLLQGISTQKTKIEETKKEIISKENQLGELKKLTTEDIGLLHPQGGSPEESSTEWNALKTSLDAKSTLLQSAEPKLSALREEKTKTESDLEDSTKEAADIEAATELTRFLDYKETPRKLLSRTVDKIFTEANKLSTAFQLGMVLQQGKNLEFNVLQSRNGREITQKTERLGFGKANVLGICTRIAAQKVLLQEPGFLLLDEPSAHVDTLRKNAMRQFLQQLGSHEGIPQIILIEHDIDVISSADQVIWIT